MSKHEIYVQFATTNKPRLIATVPSLTEARKRAGDYTDATLVYIVDTATGHRTNIKDKNMSTPTAPTNKPTAPTNKPTAPTNKPDREVQTSGTKTETELNAKGRAVKAPKPKPERVRLHSVSNPRLWCRMYKSVLEQFGAPLDPSGSPMVVGKAQSFGRVADPEARAAAKAAKLAARAAYEAMPDEQKAEHNRAKRAAKQFAAAERNAAARAELESRIKAELQAELQKAGWTPPPPAK